MLNHPPSEDSRPRMRRAEVFHLADSAESSLCAFLRDQAHCLLHLAIGAEVEFFLARHCTMTASDGKSAVVRNGYQPERQFLTHLGPIHVRIPKVRSRVERQAVFRSALVRPYMRRARADHAGAAGRFLRGLSSGNAYEAMLALVGPEVTAMPAPVMARLQHRWCAEHGAWLTGSLADVTYTSLWIEGLSCDVERPGAVESAMLAVGVDAATSRRLLAVAHDVCETAQSWATLLVGLHGRGLPAPQRLRLGQGVSSSVAEAVAMVYPEIPQLS
jgi:putative transposase